MNMKFTWSLIVILLLLLPSCRENKEGLGQIGAPSTRTHDPDINAFIKVDEPPQVIKRVQPRYPESAVSVGVNCVVYTKALVTEEGLVKRAVVIKREGGTPDFEESVIHAARQWVFTPGKINGRPTAVWVLIPFKFQLKADQASLPERLDK